MRESDSNTVYTNSIINITSDKNQQAQFSITWYRKDNLSSNANTWVVGRNNSYMCSPLDAGYYIEAQIQQQDKSVQQKLYGPVILQQKLNKIQPINNYQIKLLLDKGSSYFGRLSFLDNIKKDIEITVQKQSIILKHNYLSEDCWSKLSCIPQETSVLKIYISPLKNAFLKFFKDLKSVNHSYEYLTLAFKDSFEKDLFLYTLSACKQKKTVNNLYNGPQIFSKHNSQAIQPVANPDQDYQGQLYDAKVMNDLYQVLYTPAPQSGAQIFYPNEQHNQRFLNRQIKKQKSDRNIMNIEVSLVPKKIPHQKNFSEKNSISKLSSSHHQHEKTISSTQDQIIKLNNYLLSENQKLRKENQQLKKDKQKLQKKLEVKNDLHHEELKKMMNTIYEKMTKIQEQKTQSQRPRVPSKFSPLKSKQQTIDFSNKVSNQVHKKEPNSTQQSNSINNSPVIPASSKTISFKGQLKGRATSPCHFRNPQSYQSPTKPNNLKFKKKNNLQ